MTVHETPRLALRHLTEADAQLLFDLDEDPEVIRYTGRGSTVFADYVERVRTVYFPQYARNPRRGVFAATEKATGEFVGWFILRPATGHKFAALLGWVRDDEMEIGYRLKRAAWGRGLATEGAAALVADALADPTVPRVVGCALVTNAASCRVLEKVGLVRAGAASLPEFDAPAALFELPRLHPEPS
jgi:RimJ/RimL family protein N-acetyltransferase